MDSCSIFLCIFFGVSDDDEGDDGDDDDEEDHEGDDDVKYL